MRLKSQRGRRGVLAALVAVVALGSVAALATSAAADPTIGPVPVPTTNLTVSYDTTTDGLVAGQGVSFTVHSSLAEINKVDTKICQTGFTSYSTGTFAYTNAAGIRCVYSGALPNGIQSGGLTGVQSGYELGPTPFAGITSPPQQTFNAGTGSVSWKNASGFPSSLQCDVTHKCDLVTDVGLTGDTVTDSWFIKPLTFAGAPAAPVPSVGTISSGSVQITWPTLAAGAPSGNGTIDKYSVTATPQNLIGPCVGATTQTVNNTTGFGGVGVPVTGTSATVSGLNNFCTYDFTITAENVAADGSTHFTSPAGGPVSAAPNVAGPGGLSTSSGDSQVLFTWNNVPGATQYNVTVTGGPISGSSNCPGGVCPAVIDPAHSITVTGLTNGTTYTFSVSATLPGGTTAATSTTGTPNGSLIRQQITVDRPTGVLVISQYCSGSPQDLLGNFDPSNNNGNLTQNTVPNTLCSLTLSGPRPSALLTDAITANPRSVHDLVTNGTATVQSATIGFTANDLNQLVSGTGIPNGTRISSITNATTAVLSNPAVGTFDGGDLFIQGTTVNFGSISGPFAITPTAHAELVVNNEIEGFQIPGGTHITNVLGGGASADISSPADDQSSGLTVRIWTIGPTPAHLITSGPHAGQYFEAQGQLRQVSVVDTRTADTGWTAIGQVSAFCDPNCTSPVHSFSGDNLGWTPKGVHKFSQPFVSPDGPYSMAPAKGGPVTPGTFALGSGTTLSTDSSTPGSFPGATLAYANSGHGLGLAQLDADLLLWIPVQDPAGHYQATLTLTAI